MPFRDRKIKTFEYRVIGTAQSADHSPAVKGTPTMSTPFPLET